MSDFRFSRRIMIAAILVSSFSLFGCQQKPSATTAQEENGGARMEQEYRTLLAEVGLDAGSTPPIPPAQIDAGRYGQLLLAAAGHGSPEMLARLLDSRKEYRINDYIDGRTLLHAAAAALNAPTSDLLLERGIDPNPRDSLGRTPLHFTVSQANGEVMARLLLSRGAQVDVRDDQGMTPLLLAAPSSIKLLVDKGADIAIRDNEGNTALHWAVLHKNAPLADMLIAQEAPLEARDNSGRTPLLLAVEKGDPAMAQLLLKAGAKADTADDRGQTPQQAAERTGNRALENLFRQQSK